MQRYFVKGNIENIIFENDDVFHMRKVMRLKENDQVEVVLDGAVYLAQIKAIDPFEVEVIEKVDENRELSNDITLLYCLPKGDKLDLVIQKATEIGVRSIIGVISSRTIVHIDAKDKNKKIDRYNRIIKEASEQSKRSIMPVFKDIISYKEINKFVSQYNFIAYEKESLNKSSLFDYLTNVKPHESISILVGAEGGFSPQEVELANEYGFKNVSLGKLILRSETAAIYFMSVLSFMLGR